MGSVGFEASAYGDEMPFGSRWRSRKTPPTKAQLIERKHALEGEITMLSAELKRLRASGQPLGDRLARLERVRHEHYQTRLAIDRSA